MPVGGKPCLCEAQSSCGIGEVGGPMHGQVVAALDEEAAIVYVLHTMSSWVSGVGTDATQAPVHADWLKHPCSTRACCKACCLMHECSHRPYCGLARRLDWFIWRSGKGYCSQCLVYFKNWLRCLGCHGMQASVRTVKVRVLPVKSSSNVRLRIQYRAMCAALPSTSAVTCTLSRFLKAQHQNQAE